MINLSKVLSLYNGMSVIVEIYSDWILFGETIFSKNDVMFEIRVISIWESTYIQLEVNIDDIGHIE